MNKKRYLEPVRNSKWRCYFHFVHWGAISLGFHIDLRMRNVEIHLPFGFFRIGRESMWKEVFYGIPKEYKQFKKNKKYGKKNV